MTNRLRSLFLASGMLLGGLALVPGPASAVMPDEVLGDPALEARARALSQDLRCLVCQNQSIDDSNAPLARDLRLILRERLSKGDSDEQALAYLQARYGNFVLLKPPFELSTLLLWLGPAVIVVGAAGMVFRHVRLASPPYPAPTPLTEAEQRQLAVLTGDAP